MKRILPCFLSICILLGCFFSIRNNYESKQVLQGQKHLQVAQGEGIQVLAKRTSVRLGEIGVLALKCEPNVNCKIICKYKISGKDYCAIRNLVAGKDGSVLCTWKVDKNTDVGSYEIEIISGTNRMVTSYIVQ